MENRTSSSVIDFHSPRILRYNRIRHWKDRMASISIAGGGIGVLAAILLIFAYLLYEVFPVFLPADVQQQSGYALPEGAAGSTLRLTVEEQNEIGMRVTGSGEFIFFRIADGSEKSRFQLPLPAGVTISSFAVDSEASRFMAFGLSNGSVLIARDEYLVTYPEDKREITPSISYPYGEAPLAVSTAGAPLQQVAMRHSESEVIIAAMDGSGMVGVRLTVEESFTGDLTVESEPLVLPQWSGSARKLLVDHSRRWLYLLEGENQLHGIDLSSGTHQVIQLPQPAADIGFLLGSISLLVSARDGTISQWFPVQDADGNVELTRIRSFPVSTGVSALLATEQRRKGFAAVGEKGEIALFHTTSERQVFGEKLLDSRPVQVALSPRADRLLVLTEDNRMQLFSIDNHYPEVSWHALWQEVWYESYPEPDYTWQSSASTNDFEPKFSLTPLAFGTLKAAFYAMLLGAPLAICGAIYTAYFMTPVMRRKVKPLIELLAALPTVILGFLAGLWLAPFMEHHLAGIFTLFLVLPPAVILFAFFVSRLPVVWQNFINDGWHGLILIPVVLLIGYLCFTTSPYIEAWLFGGDMRRWLTNDMGISFDQRNALVVGVAMGIAVVPNIFSIAEDAIFSVPKHLSYGSLALGATPWQTLTGVVLPTASPGIFSALMIGMGRAVGETMIVLMATGNTPIMDANIFEGMRTLAANIAVEVPEAEVDSAHYRILFLAAFVLFLFTFVVNTGAEIIRHNLRRKYGSL